ncbi:MAG: PKD domain-containing protein [Sphingobacteriales bacterium]|nr:PKD domain-containing protein [Sphingobacteriales bacterium]
MRKRILTLLSGLAILLHLQAQDISNRGKDFWVAYGNHIRFVTGNPINGQEMVLYLTSTQTANYKIEIPGAGWSTTGTVTANTVVTSVPIPKTGANDARLISEGKFNRGIHVTSDQPIVAYAHIYNANVSGAGILFPTPTLGKEYYSINFTQISNEAGSYSWFYAVATEDSTRIQITPSQNTLAGHVAGVPFDTLLMKGEVYNVMSDFDLTGSHIQSISNGTTACKRIAVFSGSGKIYIDCGGGANQSADNFIQQCFPSTAWGKKYITVPTKLMPYDYFRIAVSDPTTVVKVNGVVLTGLINGFYYEFINNQTNIIESDKPIMVAQYITTRGNCGNAEFNTGGGAGGDGDPEMIYLSSIEQTVDNVTLNSTPNYQINEHFINVLLKTSAIGSFTLDGSLQAGSFVTLPGDPTYSYAQFSVGAGQHNLKADSGFNAIAYGYGFAESYGYNAGANVKDLYQYISSQNQYATVKSPSACKGSPFNLSVTLPYKPTSMVWTIPGYATVSNNAPVFDSTFIVNNKQLYLYKLPGAYQYNVIGNYPIKVVVNNPTAEGCSGIQEVNFDLQVFDPPVAAINVTNSGCVTDSLGFTDNSNGNGRPVVKWFWDFGDGNYAYVKTPKHKYAAAGTYNVRYSILTDVGCLSDTITTTVKVSNPPIADFTISNPTCAGKAITFTDKSNANGSTITKWSWDFGNTVTSVQANGNPVNNIYAAPGTYRAKFFVQTNTGCTSKTDSLDIKINYNPVVDFSVPAVVCLPAGAAQFNDLSTIGDGTQAQFAYAWDFGDLSSGANNGAITKNPAHNFSTVGPYTIKLTVTSKDGCVTQGSKTLSNIYPQPKAKFIAPNEICLNDIINPLDQSDGKGSTVNQWFWSSSNGMTSTLKDPSFNLGIVDTVSLSLYIKNAVGCVSDTFTKDIIINSPPKPAFSYSNSLCEKNMLTFNDASTTQTGTIVNWIWQIYQLNPSGDIDSATFITYDKKDPSPISHVFNKPGEYYINQIEYTDKGCNRSVPRRIIIHPLPKAGFISPEVCLDDASAIFKDSSKIADNSVLTYKWVLDDPTATLFNPNIYTIQNPKHKYASIGNYTAQLYVTSKDGCVDSVKQAFTVNGDIPVANYIVANVNSLCSNDSVAIVNTSTVNFGNVTRVEIYWDWANSSAVRDTDELPFSNKVYKHIYPNFQSPVSKTVQVRMLAFSGATCEDAIIKTVTLNASPKVQFNNIPGICLDATSYQIIQAKELAGLTGSFTYSGTGISSTGLFNPATAGVGVHTIKSLYTTSVGCRDSATNTIEVWPRPTADFSVVNPTCETKAITFNDQSTANAGNLAQWNWTYSDGGSSTGKTTNHTFATYGNYNVTLQVITDRTCTSVPVTKAVKVNPLPVVDFDLPKVCLPAGTAPFTDKSIIADGSQSQFTYLWNFGDRNASGNNSNTSTVKNPTHNYSALGPYTVTSTVTSKDGCVSTASKQLVDVFPQPLANFNAVTEVCVGKEISFTDLSSGVVRDLNKWEWNFGDGSKSAAQNPKHTYKDAGEYTATLNVYTTEGCISNLASKQINIRPYPAITAGPDLFVLQDGEKTIQSSIVSTSPYGSITAYQWSPGSYLTATNILSPTIIHPKDDITYILKATGTGGCMSSDTVFVKVLKSLVIPNTFTPNGDGVNDKWEIQYLDSYPGCVVEIYNTVGQLLFRSIGYANKWDGRYNGNPLPVGTYYYVIDPKNNRKPIAGYVTILR